MQVDEFIQEFRDEIGDTTGSVSARVIVSYLNKALRRMARVNGLQQLFQYHDTFELSSINADGTYSASWSLGKLGTLIDMEELRILQNVNSVVQQVYPRYLEEKDFFNRISLPEQKTPGQPFYFTLRQIGTDTKLVFDRPPINLTAVDLKYSAFHPRIFTIKEKILIPYGYCDIIVDLVTIIHKVETTDQATARALWEDFDLSITELVEMLARRPKALPYRRIKRSF